ncbi:MAG: ATP-binding protein [Clostridia bacterium]|nr:ATP-binding protein [Clostridia bacterium]
MIISISINNYAIFAGKEDFSLIADARNKSFPCNVFFGNGFNVVKTAGLFGGNNSGKTCFVRAVRCIRDVLLGKVDGADITPYCFGDSKICSLGVSFLYDGKAYRYEFKYDASTDPVRKGFLFERFQELNKDKYGNKKANEIFLRDLHNPQRPRCRVSVDKSDEGHCNDMAFAYAIERVPRDRILIYSDEILEIPVLRKAKAILISFANNIDVISMKDIPLDKTVRVLKNEDPIKTRVVSFIKASDIGIDDCFYMEPDDVCQSSDRRDIQYQMSPGEWRHPQGTVMIYPVTGMDSQYDAIKNHEDQYNLISVHNGHPVRSRLFDSEGSLKLIALASYIIDAVDNGKVLVVDELDSSLHYKLTRSILSFFNLDSNVNGQLIFTAQDAMQLNIQRLFRKDQIWFTVNHADYEDEDNENNTTVRDEDIVRLYSLNMFTAQNDGIRSDSYLLDRYSTGKLGSIPRPNYTDLIIESLERKRRRGNEQEN